MFIFTFLFFHLCRGYVHASRPAAAAGIPRDDGPTPEHDGPITEHDGVSTQYDGPAASGHDGHPCHEWLTGKPLVNNVKSIFNFYSYIIVHGQKMLKLTRMRFFQS